MKKADWVQVIGIATDRIGKKVYKKVTLKVDRHDKYITIAIPAHEQITKPMLRRAIKKTLSVKDKDIYVADHLEVEGD